MAVAMKIACVVLVCMVAASVTEAITCNDITPKLVSCVPYLQKGVGPTGECCGGVKGVNSAAKTTADRKIACGCLKSAASSFKVNNGYAASLPGKCGVHIPYAISPSTDCSKIK